MWIHLSKVVSQFYTHRSRDSKALAKFASACPSQSWKGCFLSRPVVLLSTWMSEPDAMQPRNNELLHNHLLSSYVAVIVHQHLHHVVVEGPESDAPPKRVEALSLS